MLTVNEIRQLLEEQKIKDRYGIKSISLFGSYSRGDNTQNSDIDFLLNYKEPLKFKLYCDLKKELETLFQKKVDIINNKFVKKKFIKYIKDDLISI